MALCTQPLHIIWFRIIRMMRVNQFPFGAFITLIRTNYLPLLNCPSKCIPRFTFCVPNECGFRCCLVPFSALRIYPITVSPVVVPTRFSMYFWRTFSTHRLNSVRSEVRLFSSVYLMFNYAPTIFAHHVNRLIQCEADKAHDSVCIPINH